MINKEKLAIMFSPNTSTKDKREVMQALNIRRETVNERYQGLPVHVGKSRKKGVYVSKRKDLGKNPRLEGKNAFKCRKRDSS